MESDKYLLENQIGYLLRLANQRHLEIFHRQMPELTPTQFALLVKLNEIGDASQNELGRQIGIDAATTNGVVERLLKKHYIQTTPDQKDKRRLRLSLTPDGQQMVARSIPVAKAISLETLDGLNPRDCARLVQLLEKING